jgi:hypothetical protein
VTAPHRRLTIVGGVREALLGCRLGRWEIVRPRRPRPWSSGPSTSPLGAMVELLGRTHVRCPKCGAEVVWPASLSHEQTTAFAALARGSRLEAAQFAHEKLELALTEAKALSYHITRERGVCHRCGSPVVGAESVCARCSSVNLDW